MTRVHVCILITAFCFGTLEVSGKIAGNQLDAMQLTFWRFFIGSLILIPIAMQEYKTLRPQITKGDIGHILLAGIICVPASMTLLQLGIERCNASTASIIISSNVFFTMIFAHFMLGEKFTARKAKLLSLALVGLLFLIRPWDIQEGNTIEGTLISLLAAVLFAFYIVYGKKIGNKIGSIFQAFACLFSGSLILLVLLWIMDKPVWQGVPENIGIILYTGIVVTGFGYLFLFLGIKYSDASTGSIAFFLKIVIAPILSVIVLNDVLEWNSYIGIGLVLLSSYLNLRGVGKKPNSLPNR